MRKNDKGMTAPAFWQRVFLQAVLLSGTICLAGCAGKGQTAPESIVGVEAGGFKGSGVLYDMDEDGMVILTAAHVVESAEDGVEVFFGEQTQVEGVIYAVSEHSDVAFIQVPSQALPPKKRAEFIPVKVDKQAFDGIQAEDAVKMLGAGGAAREGVMLEPWIYVEDFSQYMMLIQGQADGGMSGGGVFDGNGCFLGIVCGANDAGEVAVLPLSIITAEYEEKFP